MKLETQGQNSVDYFSRAIELYETLGNTTLADGRSLNDSLKVVGDVSLWSCLSTYLILYRFPLCFETKEISLRAYFRPYVGWLAQLRDKFFSINGFRIDRKAINNLNFDTSTVLLLRFSEAIYHSVLQPIHQKITTSENTLKVVSIAHDRHALESDSYSVSDFCTPSMKLRRDKGLDLIKSLTDSILQIAIKIDLDVNCDVKINRVALRKELHWLCTRELPRLVTLAACAYEIMESVKPSLILTGDDADQKCKLFELIGVKYSVPTFVVQQGITRKDYPDWKYFTGHHAAVMGSSSVAAITAQGVSADRLTITGHPGFDQYATLSVDEVKEIRRCLALFPEEIFILFASQPFLPGAFKSSSVRDDMIKAILNASNNFAGIKLVIKPHPSDNVAALKKLCKGFKNVIFIDKSCSISSFIKACDVFVTMFSQTTFEALYANKPVINVNFRNSGITADFLLKGATFVAHSESEIIEALKAVVARDLSFFQTEVRRTAAAVLLDELVSTQDGGAVDRVVKLIRKLYLDK
jgi:hypothetical protein